jgi:type I restriction enzyme S subunit
MKEKWPTFKLADVCDQITDGKHGDCENQSDSGFYFLSAKDILDGRLAYENARQITESDFDDTHKRTRLEPLDILFTNSGTIGRMALAPADERTLRTTFQKSVAILKPKQSVVEPRFLYYSLLAENRRLSDFAGGTAQKNLLLKDLRAFPVKVPPLAIQERIASTLSAYDDLIDKNARRIKILEEMAEMIYREWFVNFRFPGHEAVKMIESEFGMIPSGWKMNKFDELLDSSAVGDWGSDVRTEHECCQVNVIRGTDFTDIRSGASLRTPRRFLSSSILEKKRLVAGDILIENSVNAKTRSTGNSLLISEEILRRFEGDVIAASFCRVFRFRDPLIASVAYVYLKSLYDAGRMRYYQNVAANGIANFQTTRFVSTEGLLLPPNESGLKPLVGVLFALISSNPSDKNYVLRRMRDLLLPQLISGRISLKQCEDEAFSQVS